MTDAPDLIAATTTPLERIAAALESIAGSLALMAQKQPEPSQPTVSPAYRTVASRG